jgi:phosphate-selective porin OprO/OprP
MERPMVVSAFAPSRHLGIFAKYNNKYFFGSASILFQEIEGQETRTYVEDNNKDYGMDEGLSYLGKIVVRPVNEDNYGIHLGGAFMYTQPKTSDEKGPHAVTRFSCRNATNINRKKYIDTDEIKDTDHSLIATAELAGHVGGLRVESAWMSDWTYMDPEKVVLEKPYHFQGWYVEAGYLLFGGKQSYDSGSAKFNRTRNGRSWGDVELAAKYEFLDMNDYEGRTTEQAIFGGSAELYGAAINFYLGKNTKIALNYQYVNNDRYANGKNKLYVGTEGLDAEGNPIPTKDYTKVVEKDGKAGVNYHMLLARFQVAF